MSSRNVGMKWCHGEIGWTRQSRVKCSLFQQSFSVIVIIWSRGWMETPRAAKHIASLQVYFGLSHDINALCFGHSLFGMPRWYVNRFVFCCVNEQFCESYIERANGSMIRSMSSDGLHVRSFSVRCFYSLFFQWCCAQYNNLALKLLEMFRILASLERAAPGGTSFGR